jgi:Type I phosphodiesterase / nucleotide pyrophosphatase
MSLLDRHRDVAERRPQTDQDIDVHKKNTKRILGLVLLSSTFLTTCLRDDGGNVILITLDGVRHQDVLDRIGSRLRADSDPPVMPYLNGVRPRAFVSDHVRVANSHLISLPAYESLLLGEVNGCAHNDCERVTNETLPERIQRELGLDKGRVATFASWGRIERAAQSEPKRTFVNSGTEGEATMGEDSERMDEDTWALALDHLEARRPRFMYISLNDPDHWAHAGNRIEYLQALRDDDARIHELEDRLQRMGSYGSRTTVIVTTDHGRGEGDEWREHCASLPESVDIWMYASGPQVDPEKAAALYATHLDVRPTVEKLIGLQPTKLALSAIAGTAD